MPDDAISKLNASLEDANKLVEDNVKILGSSTLGISGANVSSQVKSMRKASAKPTMFKTRTKTSTFKSKLGKIMHKLYDLEPDNAPEKPLNVDLCVDLYQMENY
jgi:hypothetical protein